MSPQIDDAVLTYLDLREKGQAPSPEEFARLYPGMEKELLARIIALSTAFGVLKPSFLPPETGQRIGGYSILREIGRGSMGGKARWALCSSPSGPTISNRGR